MDDELEFYNILKKKIIELDTPNVIMAGDWNMVLDTLKTIRTISM